MTNAGWTVTDIGQPWPDGRLGGAFAIADRLRLTTLDEVAEIALRRGTFPGRARVHRVVDQLRGGLAHSGVERGARGLLTEAGVVLHPRSYPVLHSGRIIAEFTWLSHLGYGVEIDGPHA